MTSPRVRGLGIKQADRDAAVSPQPFGGTDMVGMGVGQHDRSDVCRRPPDPLQQEQHPPQVARETGTDQRHLVPVGDEHPVVAGAGHQPDPISGRVHHQRHGSPRALAAGRLARCLAPPVKIMPDAGPDSTTRRTAILARREQPGSRCAGPRR